MGFVASLWDFISGYAIAPSKSPDEESLPFSAVRRRLLRCYNHSKFGLLQQFYGQCTSSTVVITVQNSVFYNKKKRWARTRFVVITVQNSVFYNQKVEPKLELQVVITVQNSVFYNLKRLMCFILVRYSCFFLRKMSLSRFSLCKYTHFSLISMQFLEKNVEGTL